MSAWSGRVVVGRHEYDVEATIDPKALRPAVALAAQQREGPRAGAMKFAQGALVVVARPVKEREPAAGNREPATGRREPEKPPRPAGGGARRGQSAGVERRLAAEARELGPLVARYGDRLSPAERAAAELRWGTGGVPMGRGMTGEELAESLGSTRGSVVTALASAKRKLRAAESGGGERAVAQRFADEAAELGPLLERHGGVLAGLERRVAELRWGSKRAEGGALTNAELAERIGSSRYSVGNATSRARRKLQAAGRTAERSEV